MCNIKCVSPSTVFTVSDYACDYTPVISTCSNIVDLFFKAVISINRRCCDGNLGQKNRYFKHLDDKSVLRCLGAAVPLVGNVVVAIYDIYRLVKKFKNHEKKQVSKVIELKANVYIGINNLDGTVLENVKQAFNTIRENLESVKDQEGKERKTTIDMLRKQVTPTSILIVGLQHHIYDFAVNGKLIEAASNQIDGEEIIDEGNFINIGWDKITVAPESEEALQRLKEYIQVLGECRATFDGFRDAIEDLK